MTTQVWKLEVLQIDGAKTWEKLKYLKESNLVKVDEFTKTRFIEPEPTYCWQMP